jgi:hypothetical protein
MEPYSATDFCVSDEAKEFNDVDTRFHLVDVFAGWNSALHFNHQTREEEQKPADHLESIFTFNFAKRFTGEFKKAAALANNWRSDADFLDNKKVAARITNLTKLYAGHHVEGDVEGEGEGESVTTLVSLPVESDFKTG